MCRDHISRAHPDHRQDRSHTLRQVPLKGNILAATADHKAEGDQPQQALLLGWSSGGETRYVAIKDNFGSARFNDWLLINASTRPVAFKVGENAKAMVVAPGQSTNHRVSAKEGEGVPVLAQAPFDGKAKTFYSTYWPVRAGRRSVILFVDDGEKIRVKRISDMLVAKKP